MADEVFSNPEPPKYTELRREDEEYDCTPMTNQDFRKFLMTPRAAPGSLVPRAVRQVHNPSMPKPKISVKRSGSYIQDKQDSPYVSERSYKKRKINLASNEHQEETLPELHVNYEDNATERRQPMFQADEHNNDTPKYKDRALERRIREKAEEEEEKKKEDHVPSTSGYRAVGPDVKSDFEAEELRRRMIQESKYMGGDIDNTHLVKGLDFALLQKVRDEIAKKEVKEEEFKKFVAKKSDKEFGAEVAFKTKLGKDIYRTVFKRNPKMNELFQPRRMAYVFDLDDNNEDSDIPTTLIRSKAECPAYDPHTNLTTSDLVIQQLTKTLSYLRHGVHDRKGNKKEKTVERGKVQPKASEDSIFGDIGEYVPSLDDKPKSQGKEKSASQEGKKASYFIKPSDAEEKRNKQADKKSMMELSEENKENSSGSKDKSLTSIAKSDDKRLKAKLTRKLENTVPESYAECYPGAPENEDATAGSDDEVDYSKMDMGNTKGPVGRWDFDTQEEYSSYMSEREALPRAAFQYGIKMADGRKTRRNGPGKKDTKEAKLDRQLKQIMKIIDGRTAK